MYNLNEDIATVCALGLKVDDDRKPVPQNIPTSSNNRAMVPSTRLYSGQQWHWNGQCQQKLMKEQKEKALSHGIWRPTDLMFWWLYQVPSFQVVWRLPCKGYNQKPQRNWGVSNKPWWDVLLCWAQAVDGNSCRILPITILLRQRIYPYPFKLNDYRAAWQMELLDQYIYFINKKPPFTDKFWEIRQMLVA